MIEALKQLRDILREPDVAKRLTRFSAWGVVWLERAQHTHAIDLEYYSRMQNASGFLKHLDRYEANQLGAFIVETPGLTVLETELVDGEGSPVSAFDAHRVRALQQRRREIVVLRQTPKQ